MKRFWITTLIIASIIIGAGFWAMSVHAADDQYVCGKTYMYFQEEVTYLIKFINNSPDLPCTSGKATLYWLNQTSVYDFTVDSNNFILVKNVGKLIVYGAELYFLDTATIIFDQWI